MAVNKNFVVKQGLEVKQNLLVAEGSTSRIGIGTTAPLYTTHVIGGIGATDLYVSGVSTFSGAIDANGAIDVDGHTELDDVNVSGASTFTGIGTFVSDLYVGGNLNVTGDLTYDEVSGRNLDISGIATIATLGVSAATTSKDLLVTGVSTFSGIGTFASDVYIDGNLNVVGDIVYDEVSGRNINISGLSTFEGLVYAASNVGVGTTNPTAAADANNTTILNAGIVTANYFYGDISGATGVSTSFTGSIGIQSGGTVIGTGITMVNITGGGSTAWSDTNVATIKLPPAGVSIGLAIALGS